MTFTSRLVELSAGEAARVSAAAAEIPGLPPRLREVMAPEVTATVVEEAPLVARVVCVELLDGQPWLLVGTLRIDTEGVPSLSSLAVEPIDHEAEVTMTVLRRFRLALIRDRAVRYLQSEPFAIETIGHAVSPEMVPQLPAAKRAADAVSGRRRRPGRPGLADEHYRRIALLYLELFAEGYGRERGKNLYARMSELERCGTSTIRDWVRRARELGYLTRARPGRAGSLPGPRLGPVATGEGSAENRRRP